MTPRAAEKSRKAKTAEQEPAPLNRTERRQQRTRANLISAVRELTAEKGVDALTIRDIAEAADIAMGSFYNHFESKEALLKVAVEEIVFQSGEVIDSINSQSDDPLEIIATAFMTFDGFIQNDPILGWFIVRVSAHNPEWTETLTHRFSRDVRHGVETGKFNITNIPLAITLAGSSLFTFYRSRLQGQAGEDAVPEFVTMILRLLGAKDKAAKATAERVWKSISAERKEKK